jgi:hypothetical protein
LLPAWVAPKARERGPPIGVLKVFIQTAYGIAAADLNGMSDPYVVVQSGGKKQKTTVINDTLQPKWDEELELSGNLEHFIATGLKIKVMDADNDVGDIGSDDTLGEITIPLEVMRHTEHVKCVERLPTQGKIRFSITWSKAQSDAASMLDARVESTLKPSSSLPRVPVLLPHKFDWVTRTFNRTPEAIGCSPDALDACVTRSPQRPRPLSPYRSITPSTSAPRLVKVPPGARLARPRSAGLFVPGAFDVI